MGFKPLSIGFIGGGINSAIGPTHKIAASMDGRWLLSAGCFSQNEEINRKTAEVWGVATKRTYASWRDLLEVERGKLDAVAVITPTPSHSEIVIDALEYGYPVICEKALAISSVEAKKIEQIVEKGKGFLAVIYNYTGYPMVRELKRIIQKGMLGKLNQVQIEMPQEGFARLGKNNQKPIPQAWRLKDHDIPTLSLDLCVHIHHMIDFLCGEKPMDVVASNSNFGFFRGIVDNTMCIAHYTGDLRCQIWFGKTALGHSNGLRVRIYGTKGSAEWIQMHPETIAIIDNMGKKSILTRSSVDVDIADDLRYSRFKAGHPAGFIEAFANHYCDLADSLIEYKKSGSFTSPWVFGVKPAVEGLSMFEAMARSAKNLSWERIT